MAFEGNSFVGNNVIYGTTFSYFDRSWPYALELNSLINSSLQFQGGYRQWMAYSTTWWGAFSYTGGNWYPEVLDHYLGLRFKDGDNETHYGWIRCDVKDEGRTLVIKDYAYETEPDYPIRTGDTVSYVGIEEINTLNANIYSFNQTIYINLSEQINNDIEIHIYDLSGKEIYNATTLRQNNEILINESIGIYLVEIISGEEKYSKKLYLN